MCVLPRLWQRLLPFLLSMAFIQTASAVQATDVLGRMVELDFAPQRIVLGEGRLFFALALLDRDNPFQRVVGWQNDMRLLDPHTYAVYAQKYPHITQLPLVQALVRQIRLQGVLVGSRARQQAMVRAIDANGLRPVVDKHFELEQIVDAFRYQESNKHFGKICLTW